MDRKLSIDFMVEGFLRKELRGVTPRSRETTRGRRDIQAQRVPCDSCEAGPSISRLKKVHLSLQKVDRTLNPQKTTPTLTTNPL